ncbi:MAG: phosphoenolpyruvate synthase [Coxiellaceae bacterium]|nr:phosphoenolpyruvate synthase [Coxiellaceae bacterium]
MEYVLPFQEVGMGDVPRVGGKNASLGEMISKLGEMGVKVPNGFATTADAYREFLAQGGLDKKIADRLDNLDVNNMSDLASAGEDIRGWIMGTPFLKEFEQAVRDSYQQMQGDAAEPPAVAVRSSATAEDLPEASFAGQQETFLNIRGADAILEAMHQVFASLFTNRAISYRQHQNFDHNEVALSVGIQRMVRSDIGSSGVMFTVDTESGFDEVVFITSAYGLGEMVVQGEVNPDEFYVHKPTLQAGYGSIVRRSLGSKAIKMVYTDLHEPGKTVTKQDVDEKDQRQFSLNDEQILRLAKYAVLIEKHYERPMDIEWGLDGEDGHLYILQARPETVASQSNSQVIENYQLETSAEPLITGRSIGQKIGAGVARVVSSPDEIDQVKPGDVLVTDMTDPDWEPVMKIASAIVTNRGGRTCHAAIIAREMGIPAVVGCGEATDRIKHGDEVTVSCAQGDTGFIYPGNIPFEVETVNIDSMPDIPFKIMMNVANPDRAFDFASLPNEGIGLARLEFIINSVIGFHPKALLQPEHLPAELVKEINEETAAYATPRDFYVDKLAEGIATLAAAFYPKPVIVRMSDFKSNEYANLIGGTYFEPEEENPMIGFRGAARYIDESFRPCFELECEAIKKVRNEMGLRNVQVMIPFVRTVDEAKSVVGLLKENQIESGRDDLKLIMMCEIPSNAVLADQFLKYFDGFSIGSNDMTQLTLGCDRDSGIVAGSFDERNDAVKAMLSMAIKACNAQGKYIGICGQGPSDHPDFAEWLVEQGIGSVSLNPDTVIETWLYLAEHNGVKA